MPLANTLMAEQCTTRMASLSLASMQSACTISRVAPSCTNELLNDIKVLGELSAFVISMGDVCIFHGRDHRYCSMASLISDMEKLNSNLDKGALAERLGQIN